ncbi:MAG: hypothetical protein H0U74_04195 [Bradymonadaceae bacterium]|nr:hypothetical protein [Lujinxingiaceae bacterium]
MNSRLLTLLCVLCLCACNSASVEPQEATGTDPAAQPLASEAQAANAGVVTEEPVFVAPSADAFKSTSPFERFPTIFVENRGQTSEHIDYYVQSGRPRAGFSKNSVTYVLSRPATAEELAAETAQNPEKIANFEGVKDGAKDGEGSGWSQTWTIRTDFVGAHADVKPIGRNKAETIISFFKGPREEWKTAIPTYHELAYENIWPGIDLVYRDKAGDAVDTFHLQPGADPADIVFAYHGARTLVLDDQGNLIIDMGVGAVRRERLEAVQLVDGQETRSPVRFKIDAIGPGHAHVHLALEPYDNTLALTLEPAQRK